ncbi:hypothetical protein P8452_17049 [Trifolium repens]|nr:hypothetical protein P8452_17049 [Trifolium repens]
MGVVLHIIMLLFVIGFVVAAQGSEGSIISPSPAFLPAVQPNGEAPDGLIHNGQTSRSSASSPSDPDGSVISPSPSTLPTDPSPSKAPSLLHPNGSFLQLPVALPPSTSGPTPQKIKGIESSISPSPSPNTKSLSPPPYKSVLAPSTAEMNFPPSLQPIPPQRKTPIVRPPISTPTASAPVAIPPGNFPKTSPISQPIKHGSVPPEVDKRNESKSHNLQPVSPGFLLHPPVALPPPTSAPIPQKIKGNESSVSPSPSTISLSPPYKAVPEPSTVERNFPPSVQPIPPQKTIPIVTPPISTPTAPAPVAITPGNVPKTSPISQPIEHGNLPPNVDRRNESKSHNLEPVSPGSFLHTPVALPPPTSAPIPQKIKGNESSISPSPSPSTKSLSPPYKAVPEPSTAERNFPPSMQPIPPQKEIPIVRPPISTPTAPAPVAIPPGNFPKTSPISQPIKHGSVPPEVDKRNESKSHNLQPVSPGFLLHPPVALPPPTSAPIPQKIKGNESSVSPSPSTISLSPPYKAVPEPSTVERNFPPSVQPIPPQKTIPIVTPPISTPTAPAPVAITPGNVPKTSPISQPIEHGNLPPNVDRRNESKSHNLEPVSPGSFLHTPVALPPPTSAPIPQKIKGNESSISPSPSPSTKSLSPPYKAVPEPSTAERNFPPSMQPIPPQKEIPIVRPPISTPTAPAPVAIPPGNFPKTSPISQPIKHGSVPPEVDKRNESKSHNLQPVSPGFLLHPPVALPPPTSAPIPQKIKGNESSVSPSPSTISLSPPYKAVPEPSTVERNFPPSVQPIPPQKTIPIVTPPISTPTAPAPVAITPGNVPKTSPISQPIEHGNLPPNVDRRNESKSHNLEPVSPGSFLHTPVALPPPTSAPIPQKIKGNESSISPSPSPSTKSLSPPYKAVPEPSTAERNFPPSMQPIPPQKEIPIVRPPISTPTAPAPLTIPPGNLPRTSPISQPIEHGSLPPKVGRRNESRNHNLEPLSPAPVATPSTNEPKISPISHSTNNGSLPPNAHSNAPALNLPKYSPVSQPTEPGSLPPTVHRRNSSIRHTLEPVSQAPVAEPPKKFPKNSPVNQPTRLGSFPPNVHNRTVHKGHTPEPVMPPPSTFPADPPLAHPVNTAASPHELPAPAISPSLTPSRRFNGKNGGEPVSAPLYKTPKSPPAIVHSPAQAPSVHKARPLHHAPEPLISPPKSPFNKDHSPASSPSTAFYKHHHTRNTITNPAPASSYIVSPPTSKHQGSADSPFTFPIQSPASQVSPAPSPSFVTFPHSTKIPFHPPEESPLRPFLRNPKKPIQALPPPPPNEDCLSFICSEPLTNSPPGVPCMCVWPMRVGLRLSVPLYTFFPLVSELASEIATGVFMKPSQVRIMGANTATDLPDKTDALIDLVPLVEEFDNTTAFIASERFWHKQVAIKNSYFGDYEVLYVSYPGLPPSPPLPPSSVNMIDGGPYSNNGNNGRTIKPLGVDIQKKQHKSGLSKGIIAIIALSAFLAIVLCSAAVFALSKFRGRVPESQPTSTPRAFPPSLVKAPGTAGPSVASASTSFRSSIAAYAGSAKTFSMNEIEKATDNFHPSRILGEGGFGLVYSGNLEDGSKVAFKVLKREDHHGDREFLSEVEMLSRLHHRNLVKLIGICTELSFRCLVYELIPNGSVESHLHGVDREKSPLDWSTRIKIALGAARGLAYLHEDSSPHVIHRDFKSSNILLENDFTPKVSDFGLARTAADEDNRHISTRVMGTFGYVAPEYAMTGHLLVKSDVYSYGVVLLELLTGRKPVDFSQPPGQENLVAWARPLLTSREGLEALIDPSLGTNIPFDSVAKVAAIASMCVQPEVSDRPFMGEVVQALKLVCNECDEAKEAGSTNSSQEELSSDFITASEQQPDSFRGHFAAANYDYGVDIENGLAASELFSSSARFGRQVSGSFRRHSYSGPLRTGRSKQLWQIIRNLSGGSVSEHGVMFK